MGTVPMVVIVDGRCKVKVGQKIRWRPAFEHNVPWSRALITEVRDDGYFFAERM